MRSDAEPYATSATRRPSPDAHRSTFNGQIGAKDFHSAFKFARGDAANWSQEFSTEILPTIMNELKKSSKTDASQAGNALKSMSRAVVDNVMTPQAMGNWERLGMFAPGAVKKGKGGKDSVKAGEHMLGYDVFQSNPYQFVQDYLLPHMKDHGIDIGNRKEVVAQLGGLFGNRVANQIAAILATQQAQIKKDQDNIRKAQGTNGLQAIMNMDPVARQQVFAASLHDLGKAIGDLALPGNMRAMKGIIDWAHDTTDRIRKSASWKAAGDHWNELVAGFFHQKLDPGMSKQWAADGAAIRSTISNIKGIVGDFAAALAPAGSIHESLKSFSDDVAGFRKAFELEQKLENDPLGMLKESAKPETLGDIKKQQEAAKADVKQQQDSDAVAKANAAVKASKPLLKLPPMVRQGGDQAKKMGFGKDPFGGLGASKQAFSAQSMFKNVAMAAAEAIPGIQQSGMSAASALAAGLQSGSGKASATMAALMSSLAAIAAGGVTIPVKLDTAGAEAKLSALKAAAGSLGKSGGGDGRFSKALNDTGQ